MHALTPFRMPCSRTVGYRFAAQLPRGIPLVIRHCGQASEEDDELREACLQALEAFVMRSAHETRPFLDQVSCTSSSCWQAQASATQSALPALLTSSLPAL